MSRFTNLEFGGESENQSQQPKALVKDGVRTEVDHDVNVAREEVEAKQSPGSMVEVAYGVPTAAYLGLGYAAFLTYLAIFNLNALVMLP